MQTLRRQNWTVFFLGPVGDVHARAQAGAQLGKKVIQGPTISLDQLVWNVRARGRAAVAIVCLAVSRLSVARTWRRALQGPIPKAIRKHLFRSAQRSCCMHMCELVIHQKVSSPPRQSVHVQICSKKTFENFLHHKVPLQVSTTGQSTRHAVRPRRLAMRQPGSTVSMMHCCAVPL